MKILRFMVLIVKKEHFTDIKLSEFKKILDDLHLTTTSGHYGFSPYLNKPEDDLKRFVDQCIKGAHAVGMKYITWPWIAPDQRTLDNFKLMSKKLNVIGEQVKSAGLGFAYHNHDFEFKDYDGTTGYDIILRETDPSLVKLTNGSLLGNAFFKAYSQRVGEKTARAFRNVAYKRYGQSFKRLYRTG